MVSQSVVALFSTLADAEEAIQALQSAGISPSAIEMHSTSATAASSTAVPVQSSSGHGFFDWLFGDDAPEHDARAYQQGLSSGGCAVAVHIDSETSAQEVHSILARFYPIDVEDHLDRLRESSAGVGTGSPASSGYASISAGAYGAGQVGSTVSAGSSEEEIAIPIVEEELAVGKREVESGRVHVRTYAREIPVEESVTLRNRWVSVERRSLSAGSVVGTDAFQERTIDLVETAEEAVVAKTARVVDEVVVRTGVQERTETIRDSVRKTEVEVDRDNALTGRASTPVTPLKPVP